MTTLLCLVGPTAAGKTRMAVEVALALRDRGHAPEIVSCDSMAVYRGLDIVADKPTAEEQGGIPHHLFDIVDPDVDFTAVMFRDRARAAIADVLSRRGVPILVGGSGLYFRAIVDDLEFAPADPDVRARLSAEDPAGLLARLREADPPTAERLDPNNPRRIVRAAEILEITGRPPGELRGSWDRYESRYDLVVAGLVWDRPELLRRVEERADREIERGVLDEVKRIASFSRNASQALGVKEMIPVIEGTDTIDGAKTKLVRNTKNFVRRQISWFKRDPRVVWVNASAEGWDGARTKILGMYERAL